MDKSLDEQRRRLQREVQLLEESLSRSDLQLFSHDSDESSSGDTEEDQDLDQTRPQLRLLAQRDLIQRQIQDLEKTLGPTTTSNKDLSDEEDSSGDEGDLELPPSVESCLQINLVYQQVIQETLDQLDSLLHQNQNQQKELLAQMSGSIKDPTKPVSRGTSHQHPSTMYLGRFLKPYFKDKLTGLGPPANQETKEKASKRLGALDDKKTKIRRWEGWQKVLLIHAVSRDRLRKLIQPKLSKLDFLTQKLSLAPEVDRPHISDQIQALEKEIQTLREKKEVELMGNRHEDVDWDRISNIDFEGSIEADDLRLFWQNFLHPSIKKDRWSDNEVQRLKEISLKNQERDWDKTAAELGSGRTAFMCLQTYQRFVSDSLRKKWWTPEEDAQLRELVEKMRIGNFIPYTQSNGHDL